jgi:hypothetical protein
MAMQVISSVYLQLVGDGVSTTFLIPPRDYTTGTAISTSLRPTSGIIVSSPIPGTVSIDTCGNIVLTFSAPWAFGQQSIIQVDLHYPSPLIDVEGTGASQQFAVTTGITLFANSTPNLIPLLSIQPQAGVPFTFKNLEVFGNGQLYHFQLLLNATLVGANFVNVDPESYMTYDLSATSYTGGRLLDAGDGGFGKNRNDYGLSFEFLGSPPTQPTITLMFAPVGKCAAAGSTFVWNEQGSGCL